MARWEKRDSNIDPFNAGEPILPWDDPSQMHDDCSLDDKASYDAPEKAPDDYDAPSTPDGIDAAEAFGRFTEQAGRAARHARRAARRAQAGMSGGTASGKRRFSGGWIAALVALSLLMGGLSSLVSCAGDVMSEGVASVESLFSHVGDFDGDEEFLEESYVLTTDVDEAEAEEIILAQAEERFARLDSDEVLLESIAGEFADDCEYNLGFTAEELGIDPHAVATWAVSRFACEWGEAYVFDGYNGEAPWGYIDINVYAHSYSDAWWDFHSRAMSYLAEEGLSIHDSLEDAKPGESQQAVIRGLLAAALEDAPVSDYPMFLSVRFTYENDAWTLDEDAFYEQVLWGFGVY